MFILKRKYVLFFEKLFVKYGLILLKVVLLLDIVDKGYLWNLGI